MSLVGDCVSAIAAHVTTAVTGVTVYKEPRPAEGIAADPYALVYRFGATDPRELEFRQLDRQFTIVGLVVRNSTGSTSQAIRDVLEGDLQAIEALILADSKLGNLVQRAVFASNDVQQHPDEVRLYGLFAVACHSLARMS